MITGLDIYRSANLLVKQHDEEALIHAAMRADELLDAGNLDGKRVWLRILKAVEGLLARRPASPKGLKLAALLRGIRLAWGEQRRHWSSACSH